MTTTELKKRIEKKEDQINRKFKTMEKKKAQIIAKSKKSLSNRRRGRKTVVTVRHRTP